MTSSTFGRIEIWINRTLMRVVPTWYAAQIIRTIPMPAFGVINPADVNAGQWLNLRAHLLHAANHLEASPGAWNVLAKDLKRLLSLKELQRHVSLNRLNGISGMTEKEGEYASLRDWVLAQSDLGEPESADEFDQAVHAFNTSDAGALPLIYREWDGRMYSTARARLPEIGSLYRYAMTHGRDISARCALTLETVNPKVLEHIRGNYWWFIMHRKSAIQVASLLEDCGFPAISVTALPGRPDMAYLFTTKVNRKLNRVVLNLMTHHASSGLTEFGRYLSRHRYSFRNG
ncbi:hypothetical protein [uncultured Thalassolituus sp.]|uniref:hypothetical protein n=1 Tax=uncultured Thalassolituus sp. TaxID=285273 RepID=UPI00261D2355|nr:hypothetical protein [uncultured Thalassolituus sp.]